MKNKISLLVTFLLLFVIVSYSQVTVAGLESQTQTAANGIWKIVKIVAYLIFAILFVVGGVLLVATLKQNTLRKQEGDASKPIIGFVTMIIVGVVGSVITFWIASTFGFN
jgi:heme/copper-type cytochrome/quinol oxidase subunit 2